MEKRPHIEAGGRVRASGSAVGARCAFWHPALCMEHRTETKCGGDCAKCPYGSSFPEETTPTVQGLLDAYGAAAARLGAPRAATVALNRSRVRTVCGVLGIGLGERETALAGRIAEFEAAARGTLSDASVSGALQSLRSVLSERFMAEYARLGLTVMRFRVPPHRARNAGYSRLSGEQVRLLKGVLLDAYTEDPRWFAMMALAWCQGMRIYDICELKWDAFSVEDGVAWLCYTPHKTKDSSGRTVRWPVSDEIWHMLCRTRADGCPWVLGDPSKRGNGRADLRRRFNSWLRSKAPFLAETQKAAHELRKAGGDAVYRTYGLQRAADFLGDDPKTVAAHYADVHRLDFVPKSVLEM